MIIISPLPNNSIVGQDLKMTTQFRSWTNLVSNLGIITGTGSPEGVVEASQTQQYMDTTGAAGSILYIKRDTDIGGDATQGWILV